MRSAGEGDEGGSAVAVVGAEEDAAEQREVAGVRAKGGDG